MSPRGSEPTWHDLRVGITVAAAAILALVVVIALGSGRGPFRPETYTIYVLLNDAGGIRVGSPVEVGGALAGQVVDVTILAPETPAPVVDSLGRPIMRPRERDIRIELELQERFQPHITTRSRAQLASLGMGGERYVRITSGDVREAALPAGAVIPTVASVDLDLVFARVGRAANEAQEIAYLGSELQGKIESGAGTAGRLVDTDSPLYDRIDRFEDRADTFLDALDRGEGLVPGWRVDGRLKANVEAFRADLEVLSADSMTAFDEWADPVELREAIQELRTEVRQFSAKLDSGQGTLGRALRDQELFIQLRVLRQGLSDLMTAIGEDPIGSVNIELH